MSYRFTEEAESDLINIYLTGSERFGRRQAEAYLDGLHMTVGFLGQNPRAARQRVELQPPLHVHPYRSHLIFYQIEEEGIVVVRVRHGHENWQGEYTN
ncbi:plasmid stabilization system family protein [Asticcacaulis biprosthecium C19]|uniref:Plasmid stabilization system family protein n=1 Tax=Asticcacaulis biprosthecium C19 TaxID=715226 RepID=F4QP39_9CAUL|nr:type II toxin-antitoxin system RelE/ParE family toxin [Asticcacaulis biprosthecium]EGF91097.1 plasmid stabilization system family protein [Asticcacaulis biprosthecium C19]